MGVYDRLDKLDDGETVDWDLANGLLRSSKEITKIDIDLYQIFHGIDGSLTYFSREGICEVLAGLRDVWDGDKGGWNEEDGDWEAGDEHQ